MSGKKNNRQRQRRQQAAREARARALAARQRQEKKKRTALVFVVLGLAAVILLAIALNTGGDKGTKVASTTSTTKADAETPTSEAATPSVAGKPCVPVSGSLPPGAPAVPVKTGPPPAKLVVEDIKPGTGAEVPKGATVTVNYIGVSCSSGAVFDFSYGKQPATFPLANVIPGWQEGIPGMKVGGQRLLGIPSAMAYGPSGRPPTILGDESLWFVIDLIDVKAA
jgi:FKBP-type peptidyl-prolyl cis-trans isomerase